MIKKENNMKNYQKPEVEIVKFETMENVMSSGGMVGGTSDGEVTDE